MKVQDFTYLLQQPDHLVTTEHTRQLEDIIMEYPYFQAARALYLKGLKNSNSFKYNNALKVTAAYTTDRDVLFDFITSKEFHQNSIADALSFKKDTQEEENSVDLSKSANTAPVEDNHFTGTKEDAEKILDPEIFTPRIGAEKKKDTKENKKSSESLAIGQPLDFTKKEKHSFSEWLQLTSVKAVTKESTEKFDNNISPEKDAEQKTKSNGVKKKKFDRIDKFLNENPKIVPQESVAKVDIDASLKFDKNELMTETLAKVYLEQKKYKNAIQAYKILSLKYPEKSGFFADRIKAVEKIQKENTEE
ncbi:MAG: hypothetical protein WBM83_00080 [Flavobacteriaceae bacterium]